MVQYGWNIVEEIYNSRETPKKGGISGYETISFDGVSSHENQKVKCMLNG